MISLQVVRPALASNIAKPQADFIHRYHIGAAVFYLSTRNVEGKLVCIIDDDRANWNKHWRAKDKALKVEIQRDPVLRKLSNRHFFVWDGNHELPAWMEFISHARPQDPNWHYAVGSMVLTITKDVTSILNAMHDINKATENSHVKSNLVHVLFWMEQMGRLSLD